jgi:hypothetical protein
VIEREVKEYRYRWVFAHYLHIRPWELDRLTVHEFDSAVTWIDQLLKGGDGG